MEINNDEYNDEEEFLVYVDFETLLVPDEIYDDDTKINIIGIEKEHPIIQINRKIFKGTYDFVTGTNLFFNQNLNKTTRNEGIYDKIPEKTYNYIAKTDKLLKMKRIFVKTIDDDKRSDDIDTEYMEEFEPGCSKNLNKDKEVKKLIVTKTYEEALNQFRKQDNSELVDKCIRSDMEALMSKELRLKKSACAKMSIDGSDTDKDGDGDDDDDNSKDMDYIPIQS